MPNPLNMYAVDAVAAIAEVRGWNACRAAMLQESQKSAGESNNCRRSEKVQDLQAGNCRENGNSSTNNFREIAETSTGTAITPAAPDKKLTDDVLDEIIAGAKTSMEQYLALSLKAEREVWRKEGPTDDERIMAIEGIHNCERCGDEGWVVGEMGIIRCACGQAGNSPVIPDGYVMVPKEPTAEMIWAAKYCFTSTPGWDVFKSAYIAMLTAAPTGIPINSNGWIPVSEQKPDCWCLTCRPVTLNDMRFVVCPDCGNKRCPRANDHRDACTGSNEPGQEGSVYPAAQQEVKGE